MKFNLHYAHTTVHISDSDTYVTETSGPKTKDNALNLIPKLQTA